MLAKLSRPTSVPDLTNALLTEKAQIPTDTIQNLVKRLSKRETIIANSILMPMVLEWDVQQTHIGVMVKCLQTFGHIVQF